MKRFSSLFLSLLVVSSSPPLGVGEAHARALSDFAFAETTLIAVADRSPISRVDFLQQAVQKFYGNLYQEYTAPFVRVPVEARNAIGLARMKGALLHWGSEAEWRTPVTRGQALEVLFALSDLPVTQVSATRFRDIRSAHDARLAGQGILQARSRTYFGWSRSITHAEFQNALSLMAERLDLPLPPPEGGREVQEETPTQRRSTTRERRSRVPTVRGRQQEPAKKTIIIEFGQIDTGSRRSNTVRKQKLPQNSLLETVWGFIKGQYLYQDRIDEDEIAYTIAEEVMKKLDDKYSVFMRPTSASSFRQSIQGEITGIGAQVELDSLGGVTVVSPLTGSPAMQAGIKPGDRVTHVNGESILGLNLQDAVMKIRGPIGSKAELLIQRNGGKLNITVVRAKITIPEIEITHQEHMMIVKLHQFGDRARSDLQGMLENEIKLKEPKGMILDLRNNPGGLLDAAIDVTAHFLPGGELVANIHRKDAQSEERVHARSNPTVPSDMPVVVLVNKGSASASEIVAGALQDHRRATVIGEKTFGKGTVQTVAQLDSGAAMKFTIAEWRTPLGRSIEDAGIAPDILVQEGETGGRDDVLLEAIRYVQAKTR